MTDMIGELKQVIDILSNFITKYEDILTISDNSDKDDKEKDEKIIKKVKKKRTKKVKKLFHEYDLSVMTITFSECVENQVGMEQIGQKCQRGFNYKDLKLADNYFKKIGCKTELYYLNDLLYENDANDAHLLVIRNGVDKILENDGIVKNKDDVFDLLKSIKWDNKYYDTRRKRVLNKNARVNTCFSTFSQEADYIHKKGTIHNFKDLDLLNVLRNHIGKIDSQFENLNAEGNWYYNLDNCGIGMHGDAERLKVLGIRLGNQPMNLCYRWYQNSKYKDIGKFFEIMLNPGDIYIMSEVSTGNNWKKKKIKTLRHCCGGDKWMAKIKKYM